MDSSHPAHDPADTATADPAPPRVWATWAGTGPDGSLARFGRPHYLRAYGHIDPVRVELTEDPDGPYWAWLPTGRDAPAFVAADERTFTMSFTYSPADAEVEGKGRVVRLRADRMAGVPGA